MLWRSVCVFVCLYECVFVSVFVRLCIYISICMQLCVYLCICMSMRVCLFVCLCVRVCVPVCSYGPALASVSHQPTGWGFSMGTAYHYHSWRLFVVVCALPCALALLSLKFMPESPRFLLEVSPLSAWNELYLPCIPES